AVELLAHVSGNEWSIDCHSPTNQCWLSFDGAVSRITGMAAARAGNSACPGHRYVRSEDDAASIKNSQFVILAALCGAYPDYVSPGSQPRAHDLVRRGPVAVCDYRRVVNRQLLPGHTRREQVKVNVSTTGAFFQLPVQSDKQQLGARYGEFIEVL